MFSWPHGGIALRRLFLFSFGGVLVWHRGRDRADMHSDDSPFCFVPASTEIRLMPLRLGAGGRRPFSVRGFPQAAHLPRGWCGSLRGVQCEGLA